MGFSKNGPPFYVQEKTGETLVIAAIWECWQNEVWSVAMITQAASKSFAEVHNRMPLSLSVEQAKLWMSPDKEITGLLQELRGESAELQWQSADA